jgi:hypothetical protein
VAQVATASVVCTLVACVGVTLLLGDVSRPTSLFTSLPGLWTVWGRVRPSTSSSQLDRLPNLVREWNSTGSSAPSRLHTPGMLQRHRKPPGVAAATAGAAPDLEGVGPLGPGPVPSSHSCSRMEAWGDVCVYKNVCFGDQRLKYMTVDGPSGDVAAGVTAACVGSCLGANAQGGIHVWCCCLG